MVNLEQKPHLIIGAGLAGLACAKTLQDKGIPYLLIEAEEHIGGRVQSELFNEEFVLDKGFQVLLNSYPDLQLFLNMKDLKLQRFNSGAMIYENGQTSLVANPIRHPEMALATLRSEFFNFKDALLVGKLTVIASSMTKLKSLRNESTIDFLNSLGFSKTSIEYFWRPFMSGVMIDKTLSLDANYFLFLIRCFALGSVSVPLNGMAEIPKQILANLNPKNVMTNTRIAEFGKFHVTTQEGKIIEGQSVIRAHNPDWSKGSREVTTYYFTADITPEWGKWLVLVPQHLGLNINQMVLMSAVSSHYSKNGRPLISATKLGIDHNISIATIADEINLIAGRDLGLTHLRTDSIKHALPYLASQNADSLVECGDHLTSPSIQGALQSGRTLAERIGQKPEIGKMIS